MLGDGLDGDWSPQRVVSAMCAAESAVRSLPQLNSISEVNSGSFKTYAVRELISRVYPAQRFGIAAKADGAWHLTRPSNGNVQVPSQSSTSSFGQFPAPLLARRNETTNDLISIWTSSPKWDGTSEHGYTAATMKTHRAALLNISARWGCYTLEQFDNPGIYSELLRWQEEMVCANKLNKSDDSFNALNSLLNFGVALKLLATNFSSGIPDVYKVGRRAKIVWLPEHVQRFVETAHRLGLPPVADAVLLAYETGFRPQDLRTAHEGNIRQHDLSKRALKRSRFGNRYYATIPMNDHLGRVLKRCSSRYRAPGVDNLIVTEKGYPFRDFQLENAFRFVRNASGIIWVDPDTRAREEFHLHDLRGTFATRLIATTDLSDSEIAGLMAWSPAWVARIRRVYVDDRTRIDALGRRLAGVAA